MKKDNLLRELLKEGANKNEAENLASLAAQLPAAMPRGLSAQAKQRMYDDLPVDVRKHRPRPTLRWAMTGSLAGAMALLALIILPGVLQTGTPQSSDSDVRALVQPVESQLEELDMKVEELQQQETIDEVQLQEAEEEYERTYENFKKQYESNRLFKNYNWNKWQREWQKQKNHHDEDDQNSHVNGASTETRTDRSHQN